MPGLLLGAVLVCFVFALFVFGSPRQRFMRKGMPYYSELASACDSLLHRYLAEGKEAAELSGADESLPRIIRRLYPERIAISKDRVWILVDFDPETGGFGVAWKRDPIQTDIWVLEAQDGNLRATVYPKAKYASGMAKSAAHLEVAAIMALSLLELVGLLFIVRLWRSKAKSSLGYRLWWSAWLLVPLLGVLLYGLITEEPPLKPGWPDEGGQGWGG